MYLKPLTWLFCIMCTTMMPKRIRSISVCHIFCRYCLLQTEKTRKKNLKLSNFKSGKKWWWANWSLEMHGIKKGVLFSSTHSHLRVLSFSFFTSYFFFFLMPLLIAWVILFRYERTCRNFSHAGARKDDLY